MPNWKKLIVSGSDATLNSLNVTTEITGSDIRITNTGSVDYLQVNDRLQGNGSGFQFFSFNEDTTKVKFVNWYGSQDNQYGMGMLWYETWFAAIDTDGGSFDHNRRIGFYLEEPNAGATDADGAANVHPSNPRFFVDVTGSYVASGSLYVNDPNAGNIELTGNITASGDIKANKFVGDGSSLTGLSSGVTSYTELNNIPSNIVSSSTQILTDAGANQILASNAGATAITASGILFRASDSSIGIGVANTSDIDARLHIVGTGTANTREVLFKVNNSDDHDRIEFIDEGSNLPAGLRNNLATYGIGIYANNGPVRLFSQGTGSTDVKLRADNDGVEVSGSLEVSGDITGSNILATSASLQYFQISDELRADFVTASLLRISENGTGLRMTNVGAFDNDSGDFRIFATNTNLKFATNGQSGTRLTLNSGGISGSVPFSGSFVGDGSGLTGLPDALNNQDVNFGTGHITAQRLTITGSLSDWPRFYSDRVLIAKDLRHIDDSDTYLRFTNNAVQLNAGGTNTFQVSPSNVIVNNASNDVDFIVESSNNNRMIFVDAGNDKVGIGVSGAPSHELSVAGTVSASAFIGDGSGLTGVTAAGTISSSAQIATEISGAFDNVSSSLAERITAATASISDIIDGTVLVMSASYAISASHETTYEVSSSYADNANSASVAISASHAVNALTASYALNSDGSGFPFSGSAVITGSLIVSQSGIEVTGSVNVSGSVTATEYKVKNGVGTPTLTSGNSIIFSGSEAAIFKGLSLRLESFTNTETGSLTSQDGDVIYNSDRDKIMFYSASTWRENIVKGDTIESASYSVTASYALNAGAGTGFPFSGSAIITGSLLATTFISASSITGSFSGDGSGITGITIDQSATLVDTFSDVDTYTVNHGFDTQNLIINVFDENNDLFLPERVRLTDNNNINITFATASSGKVVVAKGGHIVSGSQEVSEIATLSADFSGVTFVSASHNFNTRNVIVQVYDENNYQIIPNSVELPDLDTAVIRFTTEKSGSVVIAKGGHIISSSINFTEVNNVPTGLISASGTTYVVSGSLTPADNESFDLGTETKRWRDLYLSGSSIYLDNTRLKITGSGDIEILGHNGTRRDFLASSIRIGNGESDLHLSKHSDKLLLHHTSSTAPLEMIVTASMATTSSFALTASYALNAAGDGFPFTGSAQITGSLGVTGSVSATTYYGDGSNLTGISAGSDVVETATVVDNFSAATSHTATHNFNTKNVIVQVFNNSDEVIIPSSIIANTVNTVRVTFPEAVTGRVVVAKGGHIVSGSGDGGGGGSSAGILKHAKTLTDDISIEDNYNALLISPVGFDCTVTVNEGADLHIISF